MANFVNSKWKKRTLTALSLALVASLSLGALSACATKEEEENEETKAAPTDEQVIKNGNFEFYSDKLIDDVDGKPLKKLNIVNTPDSWSFSSGSPSSDTKSGVIDTAEWAYYARTGGYSFTPHKVDPSDSDAEEVETFNGIAEAYAHWEDENVSAYDRLKFLDLYKEQIDDLSDSSAEKKLFNKYKYTVDFEDVKDLDSEVKTGSSGGLGGSPESDEGETSVLMIHNSKIADDGVSGTAQYYTSGTTITVAPGTAAVVSVSVRTDNLTHYKNELPLTRDAGAYIGVTNTVGGSTLDQMQIYNIHTEGEWQRYTVYVRGSTFATTTFRIVLGLGQGSSDNKLYAVNGYAFFDNVDCTIISEDSYKEAVLDESGTAFKEDVLSCTVDSVKDEKRFNYDELSEQELSKKTAALDLFGDVTANNESSRWETLPVDNIDNPFLTEETSGSRTYTSADIDDALGVDPEDFTGVLTYDAFASKKDNKYLSKVFENDIKDKFPSAFGDSGILVLLSSNGAAYSAKLENELFTLAPDTRLLVSFFVKTSKIESGLTGANAVIVDGENKTYLTAFDSTTVSPVDIDSKSDDEDQKDIYKGWVPCFFFLENTTESDKTFHIELSYGPTSIAETDRFDYGDGYAAFTGFTAKRLTKTEYGYATTGDRAKKVSLTGEVAENKKFDSVSATEEKVIESGPALPANFVGLLGGSDAIKENGNPNVKPNSVDAGLLSSEHAEKYFTSDAEWKNSLEKDVSAASDADEWWTDIFGNARQPLLIANRTANVSYGFAFRDATSFSTSSSRRISMRVKAPAGVKAYIYLIDTAAEVTGSVLRPDLPSYTYWYDDNGNIVNMDPSDDNFDEDGKILFELQKNGLYKNLSDKNDTRLYANLASFEEDETTHDKLTPSGTIAYYYHKDETTEQAYYYAYRNGSRNNYTYDQVVDQLPTQVDGESILRYNYSAKEDLPGTSIEVVGTGEWITVNFYVRTGVTARGYRLEVWNGNREGTVTNDAGSYVLFDNYSDEDASSNFESIRDLTVQALKDELNRDEVFGEEGYYDDDTILPEKYARYYTYTFYDAATYLRYDETTDTNGRGNPWHKYKQSNYSENLVYLLYDDKTEGRGERYTFFLDYTPIDVTIAEEYPATGTSDTDHDHDHDTDSGDLNSGNIWLLISSGILAVVLIAVIVIIIVRRIVKKVGRPTRIKPVTYKRVKPKKNSAPAENDSGDDGEEDDKQ